MADFSLKAVFSMDATGLQATLSDLDNRVGKFADKWAKIGLGAAATAFVALSKGAIDLASTLSDTSQNLGINVESLQALEAQHKRNGVEAEQLVKALEKTKGAIISAAQGDKEATKALDQLHLSATALLRLPLDKQYEAIAKATKNSTDEATAYSAVTALFGEKVGPKLMGSLKELGEVGLPGVTKSAKEAGQVMSVETIAALDKAGDAIDDFKKRAVIAVGNIIVNFRTEEGLKLLWLQLSKVVLNFVAGIVDGVVEAGDMIDAVFKGTFLGVVNFFQDAMVDAVVAIAGLINKVLPEKFTINVGNLEEFKSSGKSVSDEITEAIAKTKANGLRDTLDEASSAMVADQKKVVDAVTAIDLKPQVKALEGAAKPIKTALVEGAKPLVVDVPKNLIEAGSIAAREMAKVFGTLTRVGKGYSDQSDASLSGVLANLTKQLSTAQLADRNRVVGVGGVSTGIDTNMLLGEVEAINREIAQRAAVRSVVSQFGENSARAQFGDTLVDRALRDMQDSGTRTATATETLAQQVAALNKKLGITPIG